MHEALAAVLCLALLMLALLHFYWAVSGPGGVEGVVPINEGRPLFVPGTAACVLVGAALVTAALVAAWRAGLLPLLGLPGWVPRLGIWVLAAVFAARAVGEFHYVGFFKRVRGTLFAQRDTWIYSPLCVVLAALAAGVAALSP